MFASLLYHTNQIEDVQVLRHEHHPDKILIEAILIPKKSTCPCCGNKEFILKGLKIRKLRMAPLGNIMAFLLLRIHRLQCVNCLQTWWPSIPFTKPKKRYTTSFEKFVITLMKFATIEHVSKFLGVSWALIKNIHKECLRRECQRPDLGLLQYVGIDEFSIRKGHNYMTIFINLETGEIIHAIEGKSMENITPFLLQLKEKAVQLKTQLAPLNHA